MEDLLRVTFPRVAAVIPDLSRAAHLGEWGRAPDPGEEAERQGWYERWCHRLKHEGGQAVLAARRGSGPDRREAARRAPGEVVGDLENPVDRMDDPTEVSKGWAIGSGPVESACQTVIGERMKGGGLRRGETGVDPMSQRRARFVSGDQQGDADRHPSRN
jgi:hypothetical protein